MSRHMNWFTVSYPGTKEAAKKELKILRKTKSNTGYSYKMKKNPVRKGVARLMFGENPGYTIFARKK